MLWYETSSDRKPCANRFQKCSGSCSFDERAKIEHEIIGDAGNGQQEKQERFGKTRDKDEIEKQVKHRKDEDRYTKSEKTS